MKLLDQGNPTMLRGLNHTEFEVWVVSSLGILGNIFTIHIIYSNVMFGCIFVFLFCLAFPYKINTVGKLPTYPYTSLFTTSTLYKKHVVRQFCVWVRMHTYLNFICSRRYLTFSFERD